MREPVTVADQAVLLEPDDVDELVDMLLDAAAVIGALAGDPGAEAARAEAGAGPQAGCEELAIDLRLAAAGLDEASAAPGEPVPEWRAGKTRTPDRIAGNAAALPGNTGDTP